MQTRLAAEREMADRDRREGRAHPPSPPEGSPPRSPRGAKFPGTLGFWVQCPSGELVVEFASLMAL